jgi:hemerythrin-like domain-containing protein
MAASSPQARTGVSGPVLVGLFSSALTTAVDTACFAGADPLTMERRLTTTDAPHADVREMYMAHAMFRREFGLLPALVRGVGAGDKERTQLIADHFELVKTVLHHHHHAEDTHLWPRLLERGPEDIDPIVHVMESQHADIDKALSEIEVARKAWRDSATSERGEDMAAALDRLSPLLDEHLSMEEERVLPLIEKYVTAAEWDRMGQDAVAGIPLESLALMFGMTIYEAEPAVIEKVLSNLPEEARPQMLESGRQAFAAYSERVHRTATPPRSTSLSKA